MHGSDDKPSSYTDISAILIIITLDLLFSRGVLLHVPLYHNNGKPIIAQRESPTTAVYNLTSSLTRRIVEGVTIATRAYWGNANCVQTSRTQQLPLRTDGLQVTPTVSETLASGPAPLKCSIGDGLPATVPGSPAS